MSPERAVYVVCLFVSCVASLALAQNVSVIRQRLSFEEEHIFQLDNITEYILEFVEDEESEWPSRVWASSDVISLHQPLLITARQRTGAVTWQLPYKSGERVLHELERTLCPPDTGDALLDSDCGVFGGGAGAVSLHVGAACARAQLRLRVRRATDWRLPFHTEAFLELSQAKPLVYSYQFTEEQNSVRLMVTSEDDVCVTVSVQEYTCPIKQTLQEIDGDFLYSTRMTVQRSGLVQLSRSSYSRGAESVFYVVVVVHDSDERCTREQAEQDEVAEAAAREPGLWETVVLHVPAPHQHADTNDTSRLKRVVITLEAALTRAQFAVAAGGTLAVYTLCYLALAGALLARRWPACARLVAPRAVLAPPPAPSPAPSPQNADRSEVDANTNNDVETANRPRRVSEATFDDSDMSDSDSDDEEIRAAPDEPDQAASDPPHTIDNTQGSSPVANGALRLPARLRLAGLARRRARVLSARSRRFLPALLTVAVFYALPVVQFVAAFQIFLNVSGSLDACYYNYLCAHRVGAVADFNHVLSNLGYMLLGGLFVVQVELRRRRRVRAPRHEEYGIPPHYGLSMALGVCLMLVGVFSGIYHVCPNSLNFQFDTAFMYVLAALVMVKTFMARHPDVAPRAHAAFAALAVLIALAVWGVLGGGALFWAVATVLHVASFLMLSLHIYYLGQFRLEKEILQSAARELVSLKPLYRTRLVMLLIANAINWAFAIYGLIEQPSNFASHLLQVLLANALMYVVVYLAMKVSHGERLRWYAWCWAGGAAVAWAPALYLFTAAPARWDLSAAHARHHNQPCLLLDFYDAHDLWHLLSAFALYLTFNMLLTWDDGLAAVKRTEIAVF